MESDQFTRINVKIHLTNNIEYSSIMLMIQKQTYQQILEFAPLCIPLSISQYLKA